MLHAVLGNEVGDERPLTTTELIILNSNYTHLVHVLEMDDEILTGMAQNGCITQGQLDQLDYLKEKHPPKDCNRAVLDIMKRRSLRSYRQFIDCLKLSKRTCNINAAQILEHGEGETQTVHSVYDIKLVIFSAVFFGIRNG